MTADISQQTGAEDSELTIIVSIYNVEDTLKKCIESLQAQTCKNWTAICVDDGSTDSSGKIIDDMAAQDKRLKVIHKKNGGPSSARNTGLNHTTTPYVTTLDPDDWIEPEFLQKVLEAMRTKGCDMALTAFNRVSLDGGCIPRMFHQGSGLHKAKILDLFQFPSRTVWAKIYKMSIINEYNLRFPEDIKVSEDYYFNVTYWAHVKQYAIVNEPLLNYLYSNTSIMVKMEHGQCPYEIYEGTLCVFRRAWEYIIQLKDKPYSNQDWCYSLLYGERAYSDYIFSCAIPEEWKRELTRYRRDTHALFAKDCSHWRIFLYKIKISGYFKFWGFVGWTKKYRVMIKKLFGCGNSKPSA